MLTRVHGNLPPEVEDVMHRIIGAAIEVHRHLGPGCLESIYYRALCVELRERGISYEEEKTIDVVYRATVCTAKGSISSSNHASLSK